MLNEHEFQERAAEALEQLEDRITPVADEHEFDVESGGGMLTIHFEEPSPAKFIVSPNSPARQIWLSALSTSYKFDWDESSQQFVLDKTREAFIRVLGSLISKQLGATVKLE